MPPFLRALRTDPAIRFGLKFGLAGILAVYLALLIRLPMPTWALFTVFVLMIAQYVGAIAEKAFFRIIGTVVGGTLGYLVTAGWEQQPLVMLSLVGLVVGGCTAMFGQSRYPYAFLLCGLTMTVVVSNGLGNPDASWQFALWRTEEVILGVLVALLVQSLIWPRFARREFLENMHSAFADLRDCVIAGAEAVFEGGSEEAVRRAEDFPARLTALHTLLEFGARESQYFRDRLPTYFQCTNCLARIAGAIASLSKSLAPDSYYHQHLRSESEAVHRALAEALNDLASNESTPESRASHRGDLQKNFASLEARLTEVQADPALRTIPTDDAIAFGLHLLAADEIREQIEHAHQLIDSLPAQGDITPHREREPSISPLPPPFWIHAGIKSAIAIVAALVIDNWLQPPGGGMFVLGSWVFTALNAGSPGGRGDCRAFHYVVYSIVILLAVSLILLAARPLLASYAVMNIVIFAWLFCWAYLSFTIKGITIPMQLAMLMIVGILGLNGQEAISFQAIVDFFFGMALALVLASVIQRLLWPSLPQWEMRSRFHELLALSRRMLTDGPASLPLWERTRLALLPAETALRISRLTSPVVPPGEQDRLNAYLGDLRRASAQIMVAADRLTPLLPQEQAAQGHRHLELLKTEIENHLRAHETALNLARPPEIDARPLSDQLTQWKKWITGLRQDLLEKRRPSHEIVRLVGLSGRYEEAGRAILEAGQRAATLRLDRYLGDYVL